MYIITHCNYVPIFINRYHSDCYRITYAECVGARLGYDVVSLDHKPVPWPREGEAPSHEAAEYEEWVTKMRSKLTQVQCKHTSRYDSCTYNYFI